MKATTMVYCSQCGTQNENDAHYCKTCGHPLTPGVNHPDREWDDRCEQDCTRKNNFPHIFWGIILIIIGLSIILNILQIDTYFLFAWIPFVIAFFIILFGWRLLSKR